MIIAAKKSQNVKLGAQNWKIEKAPCANSGSSKKAPCPAAHPQYSQGAVQQLRNAFLDNF